MRIIRILAAVLSTILFCGVTLAQQPVVDIDKPAHPNLAGAQQHIVEASHIVCRKMATW